VNIDLKFAAKRWKFMCLNLKLTNCGVFVGNKANNSGSGWPSTRKTARSSRFLLGTVVRTAPSNCGKDSQRYRNRPFFIPTNMILIQASFPRVSIDPCRKGLGQTNHIERFNCTLRQRVSRLVRQALSFSKTYKTISVRSIFICHYNLTKAQAM